MLSHMSVAPCGLGDGTQRREVFLAQGAAPEQQAGAARGTQALADERCSALTAGGSGVGRAGAASAASLQA
jgi:hypothetical protein